MSNLTKDGLVIDRLPDIIQKFISDDFDNVSRSGGKKQRNEV